MVYQVTKPTTSAIKRPVTSTNPLYANSKSNFQQNLLTQAMSTRQQQAAANPVGPQLSLNAGAGQPSVANQAVPMNNVPQQFIKAAMDQGYDSNTIMQFLSSKFGLNRR